MNTKKKTDIGILEKTLDDLARRKDAPTGVFVVLLILYFAAAFVVSSTAGSQNVVYFGDSQVAVYTFAGIFSSAANLLIILMVILCGKTGFIASIVILLIQTPMLLAGIIVRGNFTSLPGVFGNAMTIVVIFTIYYYNRKVERYQARLSEQATTDLLTGLPNGFAMTELINNLIKKGTPFAVINIDINGFKTINDTFGFDMGNKVLIEVASRWKKIAEEGLSGTLDFITRINGDEFSLVVREFKSTDDIEKSIAKYEEAISGKLNVDGYDFNVVASFGYALWPEDATERDVLITYAVAAMKEIKRLRENRHVLHFTSDLIKDQDQLMIDNKVRDALEKDAVFFNLQPQYDMSHKLRGFEALARMRDTDGNIISPGEFIPAAERMGLIDNVDLAVYKKSTTFFGEIIKKSGADITLSLNVSVKHLMKSDFLDEIRTIIAESQIPPSQLEIEITESIMIESAQEALECLNELKKMGIRIAIDDFGTGYSSLSYLNSLPADILKIDKSFIDVMNSSESSPEYVEAIISLAHVLKYEVIAEGVEEQEQLDTLNRIGCDYIQGFIWGRPLPKEEAEALVLGA
ncbi:MAG: EAL domain-containing protein [Lachnospiraceae bacterium]|nr:EAL domain-containing protein [Lachnospiraceae bacterium]